MKISALQNVRYNYKPKLPSGFSGSIDEITLEYGSPTEALSDRDEIREIFRNTYGKPLVTFSRNKNSQKPDAGFRREIKAAVILSGGQAPGGHNVIAGLYDGLKNGNSKSTLYGIKGGPSGLIQNKTVILTDEFINEYRNTGGFDMIGSGRTKIETPEQFASSLETAKKLNLDAIVVIGGDDSNTNAALLAEYFLANGSSTQVIGCPKTIDGDLKNEHIETSFGFDTACKTYSELIGNICRDANSAKKYWHFIKLMGRAASHIALECAFQTQPNVCLISEEVEEKSMSLDKIVEQICSSIAKRAENGDNFGVVLVPEGLVEFIPEIKHLINELNDTIAADENKPVQEKFSSLTKFSDQLEWLSKTLSMVSYGILKLLPEDIAQQFLMDRDPHGNVQVSRIETEKLLLGMVEKRLAVMKELGQYKGKFDHQTHFFGYEGRCAFPSNFDSDYCYSLGYGAFALIACGLTGYISSVKNLTAAADKWIATGVPLTMMMNLEQRHGSKKPVIKKALVDLNGKPFKSFEEKRALWAEKTCFLFPGAIQYFGPREICEMPTVTLRLERE